MPNPTTNSGIRDNHKRGIVADFLKAKIHSGSRLSVVSAYFTIYAYDALREHLDQIDHLDFLFGEPRFIASLDPDKTEKKAFILDGNGLQLANRLEQKRVARDCAEWMRQKVDIRSIRHAQLLHGKMYHITNAGVEEAILGSSNFTVRGLGLGAGNNNIELNLEVDSNRDRRDLKIWFDELWNDPVLVEDVKAEVLQYLDQLYQNHAPEFIYFKTLFHVFENFLADQEKGGLLDQNIKIVDTGIWQALFEFQRDGVKGAINKILKHNGCILADSVGLGKTFEALAVIKYFELKNERVLVLCPKKLRENWTVYRHNDALNPFIKDRFRFGLYAVVPPHPEHQVIAPGVVFCLKQKGDATGGETVNPLQPYYLVYVRDDGTVRFSFAQPKQILEIYRLLCSGKAAAYEQLCQLFDSETKNGADMKLYNKLLAVVVDSVAKTFQKRVAAGLQTSRDFVIPNQQAQAQETTDFDLITWLVIKAS